MAMEARFMQYGLCPVVELEHHETNQPEAREFQINPSGTHARSRSTRGCLARNTFDDKKDVG